MTEDNLVAGFEQPCDLEALRKPGRNGWLREVVYSKVIENLVVKICYTPPGGKSGGKKLVSKKDVETYLIETSNTPTLTLENFAFVRRMLGLGNGWEMSRMSSADCTKRKLYKQFFKVIENSSPPTVSCNLCDGKSVSYVNFTKHMRNYHLPDETCYKCLKDFPAHTILGHTRACIGSATDPTVSNSIVYGHFFTKLEGTIPLKVTCNICDGKLIRDNFSRHFKRFHMIDNTRSKSPYDFVPNHSSHSEEQKGLEKNIKENQDSQQDTDQEKPDVPGEEKMDKPHDEEKDDHNQTLPSDATLAEALNSSFSFSDASEIYMFSETESE